MNRPHSAELGLSMADSEPKGSPRRARGGGDAVRGGRAAAGPAVVHPQTPQAAPRPPLLGCTGNVPHAAPFCSGAFVLIGPPRELVFNCCLICIIVHINLLA